MQRHHGDMCVCVCVCVCDRKKQHHLHETLPFFRSQQFLSQSRNPQQFMQPEGSLRSLQESATCTCPQPDQSSPCHPSYLRSILILPSHLRLGLMVSFPEVSPPKPCIQLSLTLHVPHAPVTSIPLDSISRIIFGKEYISRSSSLCSLLHSTVTSFFVGPCMFLIAVL